MPTTQSAGARLREALKTPPLVIPGVFNALSARLAERTGFRAVYQSGAALSAGLALPDVGLVTQTEFAEQGRYLAAAVSIPVISDADTGFGEALAVERTVSLFESAGLAGLHLEDQQLPKRCGHLSGKSLVSRDEMVGKLKAAVAARRDPSFVIIARTDARAVEGIDSAIERAQAYVEAGADMIFPEALETPEEFGRFARAVRAPLDRQHDGVRQEPAIVRPGAGEARLCSRPLSRHDAPRGDEGRGGRAWSTRPRGNAKGLARPDANPRGALRPARLQRLRGTRPDIFWRLNQLERAAGLVPAVLVTWRSTRQTVLC